MFSIFEIHNSNNVPSNWHQRKQTEHFRSGSQFITGNISMHCTVHHLYNQKRLPPMMVSETFKKYFVSGNPTTTRCWGGRGKEQALDGGKENQKNLPTDAWWAAAKIWCVSF